MVLAIGLMACLDPYRADTDVPTPEPVLVGPEGGEVVLGELVLIVPEGAVDAPVEFVIRDTGEAPPAPYEGLSTVWSFEPHGLAFAVPLQISLPYGPADADARLYWSNDEGGYDRLPSTAADGTLMADVEHFSTGFVALPVGVEIDVASPFPPADVLFVVDNSCSMYEEQTRLAADFPQVLPLLLDSGLDVHVGVTSTDMSAVGPGNGGRLMAAQGERFVTPATPNADQVFGQMVSLGTSGDFEEKYRAAVYTLIELQPDIPANVDFYRPDATLSVVFLTDEDDQSGPNPVTMAEFQAWTEQLKPRYADVAMHAIAAPPGAVCAGGSSAGSQFQEYTSWTGGELVNLCDPTWVPGLTAMADRVLDSARVTLPEDPDGVPEIAFVSDGVEQPVDPASFTWDAPSRTAYFDLGVRPLPTDTIRVRYDPL